MLPAKCNTWICTKYGVLFHFDHFCEEILLLLILAIEHYLSVQADWYFEYLFAKSCSLSHIFRFRKREWLAIWEQWDIFYGTMESNNFHHVQTKRVKVPPVENNSYTHSCSFIFKIKRSILLTDKHSCLVSLGDICPDTIEWVSKGS